jgi:iron complex outermembrane receptor protein
MKQKSAEILKSNTRHATDSINPLCLSAMTLAVISVLSSGYALAEEQSTASNANESVAILEKVVVTSRNREEIAQDVPIPISVIGGKTLDREGVVALEDLVKKAPGLEATVPNSRRTGISIRGIGKSAGNDALEASMGVIVDNIFLTHPGMTYQDFTDLDRVEVLRGPQGTLLGKNTTIGAINYVSKAPSFTPQASAKVSLGNFNSQTVSSSISDAIVDGVLAYRTSFFVNKQDGFLDNVNPVGGATHEKNRSGGRLQFLITPSGTFSAKLNIDYSQTNERGNTKPPIATYTNYDTGAVRATAAKPTFLSRFTRSYFNGYAPIVGSWNQEDVNWIVPLQTANNGVSAELTWDLGNDTTITSITGARKYSFDSKNDSDGTKFDTGFGGTNVDAGQVSQELRLAQRVNEKIDYQTGLYYVNFGNTSTSRNGYGLDSGAWNATGTDYTTLYANSAGVRLMQASLNNTISKTAEKSSTRSSAVFGQLNWHIDDRTTLTAGLRDTLEDKTNETTKWSENKADLTALGAAYGASAGQITAAKAIQSGTLGTPWAATQGTPIKDNSVSWLLSPSYKWNDQTLFYASAASGQKSGSVQFSNNTPQNVNPEKVFDLEAGFKSVLNGNLLLNVNVYRTTVKDYQQITSIYDAVTTAQKSDNSLYYASVLGNIPGIVSQGIEVDGGYSPSANLSFSFGAALNDAKYSDWTTATCPAELNPAKNQVCDNTGKQVTAAPKIVTTVGLNYRHQVTDKFAGRFWWSNVYRTRQNFDVKLSNYGWQEAYALNDFGIGIASARDKYSVDLVVKNAFNVKYTTSINGAGTDVVSYDGIGSPRTVSLVLNAKL